MRRGRTLPSSFEHATIKYQQRPKRVLEETHWTTLHGRQGLKIMKLCST
jgi:hypothetical protein